MKIVVTDTGPLLHLLEASAIDVLRFVGDIHIPQAVEEEIDHLLEASSTKKPSWIRTVPIEPSYRNRAKAWLRSGLLDKGESYAIALAQQIEADGFLTDDAAARLFAQSLEIEVHGSLGVVLWSAATGQLTRLQAEDILKRLGNTSLWITTRILAEALRSLEEMY